jgi:hypothetical protein
MTEQNNHTTDAPDGWDRYGAMLRNQPSPSLPEDRASAMMARVNAAIDKPARFPGFFRFPRVNRWVLAPALGVATLLVILLVNILGPSGDSERRAPAAGMTAPASSEAPRQPRKLHRRPLQAPEVTDAPEPMSVDSALPGVALQPPHVDSAVPDVRPGPAPGPHSSAPSPGPHR